MDLGLIFARIIHVMAGVLWVGTVYFITIYLAPTLGEMGPDAGKVMAGLMKRKFMVFLPVVAVLSVLSGFYLYWKASMGFTSDYMGSRTGMMFGTGGVLALLAFLVGMTVTRPAMTKATALGQQAASATPAERETMMKEAQALREKSASWSKLVLLLLLGAALAMSVARYV